MSEQTYKPVDVEGAKRVAVDYEKDIVAIVSFDRAHGLTHVTTYGRTAPDKRGAAELGEILARAALGDEGSKALTKYEDYRDRDPEVWAQERETLIQTLRLMVMIVNKNDPQVRADPIWLQAQALIAKLPGGVL